MVRRCGAGGVVGGVRHKLSYRVGRTIVSASSTVACIFQMRYLIFSKLNLMVITSTKSSLILQLSQLQNLIICRSSCGTILSYTCISLVIQRLRRHYTLTGLSSNRLFLSTINKTSQRRNQQRCQNCQNNQNHDQLYQRKPPFLLRRFCCSAIIFSIMILFLQFNFCFSISVSCGGAPQSYTYCIAVMPAFSLPLPRFSPEYRTAGR